MGQSAEQLRQQIDDTRGDLSGTLDAIGDRLSPGRMIERRKNRVVNGWQNVRERVMGSASDVGSSVGDAAGGAVDTIKDSPETLRRQAQGNPLAAGAVAVGVGVLLASMFPATEPEQRAAGQLLDKAEPLKDELRETGQQIVEHVKEPARQAVQHVKDTATQSSQAVADTAKQAAETTTQTAKDATDNIRTETPTNNTTQHTTPTP
jgi:gas vesicle protein